MRPANTALAGAVAYEFRMQVRRPAVWIAIGGLALLLMARALRGSPASFRSLTPLRLESNIAIISSYFLPIIFGILLADRLPRERRLGTTELLASMPVGEGVRLWGKYLGAVGATLLPVTLAYLLTAGFLALRLQDGGPLLAFLPVFFLVVLPGLLFVGAFSIGCPAVIPTPLYAILFTGYWFWGNVVSPSRVPTISCTPLTPIGRYAAVAFFDARGAGCGLTQQALGIAGGIASIALLLAVGGLLLVFVQGLSRQQARRR
jgi:ABC-2 type transport system permease protein